ncbi:MAG: phosphoenolpyruvate synthase, partial [Gammaproteobacteria bacterium]|nr:phosphoenolpyruvate synthase [Gammaproteobacteria bacterium]
TDDPYSGLEAVLDVLEELKDITLSPERFEAREDIFHKRHIATDIPSVYGRYQEKKFDALSLSFRLENMANVYLEQLTAKAGDTLLTQATFYRVVKALRLFIRALAIDGIASKRLENQVDVLEKSLLVKRFSYLQYLDIFRGLSEAISDIRYTYYTNHHRDTLAVIVPQITQDAMLPAYRNHVDGDTAGTLSRISESFERDLIAETIGIQSLDNFITRVYQVLNEQEAHLSSDYLDQLMTYDPKKLFCQLHSENEHTHDLIHLGNKGYNLVQLIKLGVKVPTGSVLTSEFFRCQEIIRRFPPAWQDFTRRLDHEITYIEQATGRRFGSHNNPLLVSVRSCPIISMPGMMSTIHNLGLNEEIVQELAQKTGKPYFAWDTYRRFIQSWCMSGGMGREEFSTIMREAKERHGVDKKQQFNAEQMRELTMTYKQAARDHGLAIPDDPWMQLHESINMVIGSWNATEAVKYRSLMDISNEWGTAVLIQGMVFGNLNQDSGTGVLFTAHPYRKLSQVTLWGDYTPGNQGEDIVGGLVATMPISIEQAELDDRPVEQSMEVMFPEIYNSLLKLSRELVYNENWNKQEMEFTFEG